MPMPYLVCVVANQVYPLNLKEENFCLSCAWCNSFKGSQTHAVDPFSKKMVSLFNPITDAWHEHFVWKTDGTEIVGLTAKGRATIIALKMNNEFIVPARRLWVMSGWHPPK